MTDAQPIDDGVLAPEDLTMLQRVFDTVLERRRVDRASTEADMLAATLIQIFIRGVREEYRLAVMMDSEPRHDISRYLTRQKICV